MAKQLLKRIWGAAVVLAVTQLATLSPAWAEDPAPSAYDVVQSTTDRVMAIVQEANDYADEDPERYFSELQAVLDDVVDFAYFSRSVMGPYATRKRYQSLDTAGKQELRVQVERFTEVMRDGLVRTYGKGLLAFGGSRVEVQRPKDLEPDSDSAEVRQLIYSEESVEPYVIEYQMRRKDEGWLLRNMIVETINLGIIYRNQFQAAARDADGDLNQVIENWTTPDDIEAS